MSAYTQPTISSEKYWGQSFGGGVPAWKVGAKGDGSNDDTAALLRGQSDGPVLLEPGATYRLAGSLPLGSGAGLIAPWGRATLLIDHAADGLTLTGASNVIVRGVKLDGASGTYKASSKNGVRVFATASSSNVFILDSEIVDFAGCGVLILGAASYVHSGLWIQRNRLDNMGAHAICTQDYCNDVFIDSNRISRWGRTYADRCGVVTGRSSYRQHVRGNIITGDFLELGISPHSISIDNAIHVEVSGNLCDGGNGYALEVGFVDDGVVAGNTFKNTKKALIGGSGYVSGTKRNRRVTIGPNTLTNGGEQGIYFFVNSADGVVIHEDITLIGNIVTGCVGEGIDARYIDGLTLNGNQVRANGGSGVYFDACSMVATSGNIIRENAAVGQIAAATSITRSGEVATVTRTAHGLATGNLVMIRGATQAEYNGVKRVTVVDANSFTIPVGAIPITLTSITRSGSTATVTKASHGLTTGDYVIIKNAAQADYNGEFQVTLLDANTFTYAVSGAPATPATAIYDSGLSLTATKVPATPATGSPVLGKVGTVGTVSIALVGGTATVTHTAHGFSSSDIVLISGCYPAEFNGVYSITVTGTDTYTYVMQSIGNQSATGLPRANLCTATTKLGVRKVFSHRSTLKDTFTHTGDLVERNGAGDWEAVSINAFRGLINGIMFLPEAKNPRAENLTAGSNVLDRGAVFFKNNKFVICYNNGGTLTYVSIPLDGSTATWTHSTTQP